MRLAIPSDDGVAFAAHTGRAAGFIVFDIHDGKAARVEFRQKASALENHGCHDGQHHSDGCEGEQPHDHRNHGDVLDLVSDCSFLLAGGAGPRLINDLARRGIRVCFCREAEADVAAQYFARGELEVLAEGTCDSHKHGSGQQHCV